MLYSRPLLRIHLLSIIQFSIALIRYLYQTLKKIIECDFLALCVTYSSMLFQVHKELFILLIYSNWH